MREGSPLEPAVINSAVVRVKPIALTALAAITERVRIWVLRWFAGSGMIGLDDVRAMLTGECCGR